MSEPGGFEVRPVRHDEAARVGDLHRIAFPDYESSRLGRGYCRRLVLAYAERPDSWVLVAAAPGGPIEGFLVGAPPEVQRQVNASLLVPWGVLGALRSPGRLLGRIPRAWTRLRRGRSSAPPPAAPSRPGSGSDAPPGPPATIRLVLVGVDPAARGRGAADALLEAFADRARGDGHEVADLSVATGNVAARRAYERRGWREVGVEGDGVAVRCRLDLSRSGPA